MSTRGAIVRVTGEKQFTGVYHHWDSYPDGLGKTLWDLYHGHFNKNIDAMLKVLIDDHPAGWSTINNKDFNIPAGFNELQNGGETNPERKNRPECYCHGDRHEYASVVNEKTIHNSWIEYLYAFTGTTMIIYSVSSEGIKQLEPVNLNGIEPNWDKI